jgi:hypothetical protein
VKCWEIFRKSLAVLTSFESISDCANSSGTILRAEHEPFDVDRQDDCAAPCGAKAVAVATKLSNVREKSFIVRWYYTVQLYVLIYSVL